MEHLNIVMLKNAEYSVGLKNVISWDVALLGSC
jgi:hypothetical protein